jgi:predicted dehydrogenase
MKSFRWGVLATGNIAGSMAEALNAVAEADLIAVASRTQESAERFGEKWNVPRRYGNYEALAADSDVDIIYVATPHSFHAENVRMCLEAGKHVLCEKPLTLNASQTSAIIDLARAKGLFLMEAVWMRFFPAMLQVQRWVQEGAIGDVRLIQADFCFQLEFDPSHRLFDPALGGGALLDVGIYPLSFTTMLLGFPDSADGAALIGSTGVDEVSCLTLTYANNVLAQLTGSMCIYKPQEAFVVGQKGFIKVHAPFFCPSDVTLHCNQTGQTHTTTIPYQGNGYPHEVVEVHRCLSEGKLESERMPLDDTLQMMRLMDGLRRQWPLNYPCDSEGSNSQ